MRVLRARLYEREREKQRAEQDATRRSQIGSGERAEKIRTYNFAESRVTDHRIKLTQHRLDQILEGELDEFTEALDRRGPAPRARRVTVRDLLVAGDRGAEPGRSAVAARRRRVAARARARRFADRAVRRRRRGAGRPRARLPRARRAPRERASRSRTCSASGDSAGSRCASIPRVLIPRPETEVLVERCLELIADRAEPACSTSAPGRARSRWRSRTSIRVRA